MQEKVLPDFRITKNIIWCTELPSENQSKSSPAFSIEDNEYFLQFVLRNSDSDIAYWNYSLHMLPKTYEPKLQQQQQQQQWAGDGIIEVGIMKDERNKNLCTNFVTTPFKISLKELYYRNKSIWSVTFEKLKSKLRDTIGRNYIKFRLYFDNMPESLLNICGTVTGNQPKAVAICPAPVVSQKPPDSAMNIHLEALIRDITKLLDKNSSCDVKITCEGKTFNAHRVILGMRSAVFSAMFESDMIEAETGLVKVEDFSASTFQSFLRYLYSGKLPELNVETAKQLYEIADKYAVEELKATCSDYWSKNLSESTACEILVVADQHGDAEFRKKVVSYIVDKRIPQRDSKWPNFTENYSKLAVEVLNLYIQKYCP